MMSLDEAEAIALTPSAAWRSEREIRHPLVTELTAVTNEQYRKRQMESYSHERRSRARRGQSCAP
jgi:hypothetical protein